MCAGDVLGQHSIGYARAFLPTIDGILVPYHDIPGELNEPGVVLMDIDLNYMRRSWEAMLYLIIFEDEYPSAQIYSVLHPIALSR